MLARAENTSTILATSTTSTSKSGQATRVRQARGGPARRETRALAGSCTALDLSMLRALGVVVVAAVGAACAESVSVAVPQRHTLLARPSVVCADPADCTPELQSALDRGGTIVLACGHAAEPWITRPFNVTQNNTWVGIAAGCLLVAKRHEFHGVSDSLITVRRALRLLDERRR